MTRFDERDTVFSREALVWGSAEEIEYHRNNPGKEDVDRRLARFILSKMEAGAGCDRMARAVYESHFMTSAALALPDMVDGVPAGGPLERDPREATLMIKEYARAIGADDVRIGPLRPEWVYSHRGSRPFFGDGGYVNEPYFTGLPPGYEGTRYGDPLSCDHPTAVSMAFGQEKELIATGSSRAVDFEVGRVYARSVIASVQLARFIRALGWPARAHHMRNYLILCVPVAVDAGIGELARCGYVVSRSLGANFRLSAVTTAMPLAHDGPVDIGMQDFCAKCRKCAENCPSGAIPKGEKTVVRGVSKWAIDAEACLLYWGRSGYTCSICSAVCPWTKPRTVLHRA
ncbi:MAG: reductive dehalogenase, partial [Candidatus Krumholzibacteria bacterium]|nr:reductive dehalogenase [Candidatus Krumholzibacteria bacterium]